MRILICAHMVDACLLSRFPLVEIQIGQMQTKVKENLSVRARKNASRPR